MDTNTKIMVLVETRINGNSIKGNETYENMLKSVTKNDIRFVAEFDHCIKVNGTKLEMIEQMRERLSR